MTPTKTIHFEEDILDILKNMIWSDDGKVGKINSQLDRNMYVKVNKALEIMGGKWNTQVKGHIFSSDPRLQVKGLVSSGSIVVVKEGWFPTPKTIVDRMMNAVSIPQNAKVLEPSAGEGAIAEAIRINEPTAQIKCVEINANRARILAEKGFDTVCENFLGYKDSTKYDCVLMNPPFECEQDISHVMYAYEFLKPNGKLVAIMSEGAFFRTDRKATDFRDWLRENEGMSLPLPENSFVESGTRVYTRLVMITKLK